VRAEFIYPKNGHKDPFLEALGGDARNVQGRGEHEDMPDNQDRVAAGVGGMVGLRRAVAMGVEGYNWDRALVLMSLWIEKRLRNRWLTRHPNHRKD